MDYSPLFTVMPYIKLYVIYILKAPRVTDGKLSTNFDFVYVNFSFILISAIKLYTQSKKRCIKKNQLLH